MSTATRCSTAFGTTHIQFLPFFCQTVKARVGYMKGDEKTADSVCTWANSTGVSKETNQEKKNS